MLIKNGSESLHCGHSGQALGAAQRGGEYMWGRGQLQGTEEVIWVPLTLSLQTELGSAYRFHQAANVNTDIFNLFLLWHISGEWPVVFVEALESRRRRITEHHGSLPSTACSETGCWEVALSLKCSVSLAGGGSGWWWASCCEQPPGYTASLLPALPFLSTLLFSLPVLGGGPCRA